LPRDSKAEVEHVKIENAFYPTVEWGFVANQHLVIEHAMAVLEPREEFIGFLLEYAFTVHR
jgi:hypothetical protein